MLKWQKSLCTWQRSGDSCFCSSHYIINEFNFTKREREHHLFLHSEPGVVLSQNISRGGGDKRATCKSGISCNVCTATARRKWVNVRRFKSWFSPKNHESSRDVPVAILVSCMCSLCQHQLGIIWIMSVCSCPQLRSPSLSVIDSIFSIFSTN